MTMTQSQTNTDMTAERLYRLRKHAEENLHRVEFHIENGKITARIVCMGGLASACHMACTIDGEQCECDNPDLQDAERCLWVEWMTHNSDPIDFHVSDHPQIIRNAGIIVWWEADDNEYLWTYKEVRAIRSTVDVIEGL